MDIKKLNEDIAALYADAKISEATYAEATPEEQKAHDDKLEKLAGMQKTLAAAEKLAKFAYSGERPEGVAANVERPAVVVPSKSPAQKAVEAYNAIEAKKLDRNEYAAQLSAWVQGQDREAYAAITTTTANGALVPSSVGQSLNLVNVNPYRQGLAAVGKSTVSYGSTEQVVNPVVSPFAGSALPEDGSTDTSADANGKIGTIVHNPKGYQSGTFWYSGLEINALKYDVTASHLPALSAASDYAAAAAVTAVIKADVGGKINTANANVATASTTTVTQANLDAALNRVAMVYRSGRVLHLSPSLYALAEALADSTGRPLLTPDLQNQTLLRYRGVPVVMDPTLDAMGATGNLVGTVVSYTGFEWRDEQEKLLKYVGESANPDKTGLNHIRYCDGAFYAPAIVRIVN